MAATSEDDPPHVVILAAGRSQRYFDDRTNTSAGTPKNKVLETFHKVPLIQHVVDRAKELLRRGHASDVTVVVSDDATGEDVVRIVEGERVNQDLIDRGALRCIRTPLSKHGSAATLLGALRESTWTRGRVLVLLADVPLVSTEDLQRLLGAHAVGGGRRNTATLLGVRRADPENYGRLLCSGRESGRLSRLAQIVEPGSSRALRAKAARALLVNAGPVVFEIQPLQRALEARAARWAKGASAAAGKQAATYSSIANDLVRQRRRVVVYRTLDQLGTTGINTPEQLATLEAQVENVLRSVVHMEAYQARLARGRDALMEKAARERIGLEESTVRNLPGLEMQVLYKPSGGDIGGDFYRIFELTAQLTGVLICDAEGHGRHGLLQMLPMWAGFVAVAQGSHSPKHVVQEFMRLSRTLKIRGTLLYFMVEKDPRSDRRWLYAVSAGHPHLIVVGSEGEGKKFPGDLGNCGMIGGEPGGPLVEDSCELRPGDLIVGYTDGLSEAMPRSDEGVRGEAFERSRIKAIVERHCTRTVPEIADALMSDAAKHAGGEFEDDVTLVVIRIQA